MNKDAGTTPGELDPLEGHMRRRTPGQFEQTIESAFGEIYAAEDLPQFNDDIPTIGLSNDHAKLRIGDTNIDSIYDSARALSELAIEQMPIVSDCVNGSGDACFTELVDTIGGALWRRPVTDEERQDLLGGRAAVAAAPGTRAEQAEFLLQAMILSPSTMYRPELGTEEGGALSAYELASALSYTLWNAPPDAELMGLAASGALRDTEVLRAQARRMTDDPRLADALTEFFMDYLKFDAIFAKRKLESLGLTTRVRQSMVEGAREDLRGLFAQPGATVLDPFNMTSFHVDRHSATFFGVPVESNGFEIVSMDPEQRLGVLSHPGFLTVHAGEGNSGIVKRGVFTLEQLLCVHLGAPPNDIGPVEELPEGFDPERETSRRVLEVQHSGQSGCVGCHRVIDPAGFGFENYDGAGRYRLTEKGDIPIDASGTLTIQGESLEYQDSVSFIGSLGQSQRLRRCISDNFLTYALGEETSELEREAFYTRFDASNGSIDALVDALIDTPSFTVRTATEEQ